MPFTLTVIFYVGLALVIACGIWIALVRERYQRPRALTLLILIGVCLFMLAPLTAHVGTNLARGELTKYNEFWNGYETAAKVSTENCTRDGGCNHTYDCDSYTVTEVHTRTDSKGNVSTYTTTETRYHSCPVATQEFHYWIETTLGNYDVDHAAFAANPQPYRSGHNVPGGIQRGEPAVWAGVRDRISKSDPGPVTAVKTYDNYILASQNTLLHKYSDNIKAYQAKKLLPPPAGPVHDLYRSDKVSFIGYKPADPQAWQDALARLNAAAGTDLQGDVHLVLVNSSIGNPDEYTGALSAYWQSKLLKRDSLSKNGIGIVVGIEGDQIRWARAFTGMPRGNEGLMQDIQSALAGKPATPDAVIGHPVGTLGTGEGFKNGVKVSRGNGAIESALWGPNKFVRVSMSGDNKGAGYKYLKTELQPAPYQKNIIEVIAFGLTVIISSLVLAISAAIRSPYNYY